MSAPRIRGKSNYIEDWALLTESLRSSYEGQDGRTFPLILEEGRYNVPSCQRFIQIQVIL